MGLSAVRRAHTSRDEGTHRGSFLYTSSDLLGLALRAPAASLSTVTVTVHPTSQAGQGPSCGDTNSNPNGAKSSFTGHGARGMQTLHCEGLLCCAGPTAPTDRVAGGPRESSCASWYVQCHPPRVAARHCARRSWLSHRISLGEYPLRLTMHLGLRPCANSGPISLIRLFHFFKLNTVNC